MMRIAAMILAAGPALAQECTAIPETPVALCPDDPVFEGWTFGAMSGRVQGIAPDRSALLTLMRMEAEPLPQADLRVGVSAAAETYRQSGVESVQLLVDDRPPLPGAETARTVILAQSDGTPTIITLTFLAGPAGTYLVQTGTRGETHLTETHAARVTAALAGLRGLEVAP